MGQKVYLKAGDRILFVGNRSSWIEIVERVTEQFVFTRTDDPRYKDDVREAKLHKLRISPVPDGVTGVVGCYRRSR